MNNLIERKQDLMLKNLENFYLKHPTNMKTLFSLLSKESPLSLRLIDYLCTNYSKHHHVVYFVEHSGKRQLFNLHTKYRGQLKAYSKLQFDPFRRHDRIHISCSHCENKKLETTVAQLNFFKWAIENKVLDWLSKNIRDVEEEMSKSTEKKQKSKKK
tara:strand:- start:1089 stop:1559 length:471 start_codon:yes stop_codon:yes gene_type:complete